jgi:hypothetical protein
MRLQTRTLAECSWWSRSCTRAARVGGGLWRAFEIES